MLHSRAFADYSGMAKYLFQFHHGHIIVNVEGRPCLLDSGAPFSVGYEPLRIGGQVFTVEDSYMGVTASYLSEHIGIPVEGMIGADVMREFNMSLHMAERMVQFNHLTPVGDIAIPVQLMYGELPVISVRVQDRVRRMFFDTGASTSYLLPDALIGTEPDGRHEDFYPLVGSFLTAIYHLPVEIGGHQRRFRFGQVPEELRAMLRAANVQGMIGTELLRHFGVNLSLRDKVLHLESPHNAVGQAAGRATQPQAS